jgi:hypothetical protein
MVSGPAGRTAYIDADFTQPRKILDNPQLRAVLDLDQPVGLLMIAVLMLARDSDDPWSAVRTLMDELPSGSYLAITHPGQDFDPEAMDAVVAAATSAGKTLFPRERAEVQRFFGDWELVEPGVVPVMTWHPDREPPADTNAAYYWAGLARKRRSPLAARRSPLAARRSPATVQDQVHADAVWPCPTGAPVATRTGNPAWAAGSRSWECILLHRPSTAWGCRPYEGVTAERQSQTMPDDATADAARIGVPDVRGLAADRRLPLLEVDL